MANLHPHGRAGRIFAGDYVLGDGVLQETLDRPFHRPRTELRIITFLDETLHHFVGDLQRKLLLGKPGGKVLELEFDNLADLRLGERIKLEYFIKPVEEFRAENILQRCRAERWKS